jgi:nicotinamide-nucleotide amidase
MAVACRHRAVRYARPVARPVLTAELLSVGTELTVGETRDTNAGDVARSLTDRGVSVRRIQALRDDLGEVTAAFADAASRADLVVSTGGLGPTPDDLTREAIAAMLGETPTVDEALETWLRDLWARRGMDFPEMNLKQAWLVPSATAIPNANGTAPGWWVKRSDGGLIVALPGPPSEMRPMWDGWVLPRLEEPGMGRETEHRTLRLMGIGESQAAAELGEELLRATNPSVATYARQDAVDVRISAVAADGRRAKALADEAEGVVLERLGAHVWARGATSWPEAIQAELDRLGWSLATVETGTGGSLATLLGAIDALRHAEVRRDPADVSVESEAESTRRRQATEVALAVRIASRGDDTAVSVAVATDAGVHRERRVAFLAGEQGRRRAGLVGADVLLRRLRAAAGGGLER